MTSIFLAEAFETSKANMAFDEQLVQRGLTDPTKRFFRFYEWKKPSLTTSFNKMIPKDLCSWDHALRGSGGGLVFHSPNDLVFSVIAQLNDPLFPRSFKQKIQTVSDWFFAAFSTLNISLERQHKVSEKNIAFCNSYPNPYEGYIGTEKVVAFAIRRYRSMFLVQGIVHLQSNWESFQSIPQVYHPYLSAGLNNQVSYGKLSACLTEQLQTGLQSC